MNSKGDSKTNLGGLCQYSVTTLTVKKCFQMFRGCLLCFDVCPLSLVLALGTTDRSLVPSSLHPLLNDLYTLLRSSLNLFSRLTSASSLSLSSPGRCLRPFLIFMTFHWTLQYVHVFFVQGYPAPDTALSMWSHQCRA